MAAQNRGCIVLQFCGANKMAGLPDFFWSKHTKTEKYTKLTQNKPNGHKMYQMVSKYSKWS
jgi:hypothetical protein